MFTPILSDNRLILLILPQIDQWSSGQGVFLNRDVPGLILDPDGARKPFNVYIVTVQSPSIKNENGGSIGYDLKNGGLKTSFIGQSEFVAFQIKLVKVLSIGVNNSGTKKSKNKTKKQTNMREKNMYIFIVCYNVSILMLSTGVVCSYTFT